MGDKFLQDIYLEYFREDSSINFVLYNVILTFGGWGFPDMTFSIFLCQNLESANWLIRNRALIISRQLQYKYSQEIHAYTCSNPIWYVYKSSHESVF